MPQQLRRSDRFHDRQAGIEAARVKQLRLDERAGCDHAVKSRIDRREKRLARGLDDKARVEAFNQSHPRSPLNFGQRRSASLEHFPGPDVALAIARRETRHRRIENENFAPKRLGADFLKTRSRSGPHLGRNRRRFGETGFECAKIKTGAADDNCGFLPLMNVCNRGGGGARPFACGISDRAVDIPVKMMPCRRRVGRRRARRQDIQVLIDLHRIGIDDFAVDFPGKNQRRRRLAARRRACNKDRPFFRLIRHLMSVTAITLVCNPETEALGDDIVDEAAQRLLDFSDGADLMRRTLAENVAEDFLIERPVDRKTAESLLSDAIADAPVDIIVQPAAHRRKRLLIADMDSTIIGQECIDELAEFAGLKREISAITERAMRGELAFEAALIERVSMLKGLAESVLEEAFRTRITLNPGARTLVQTMNRRGATTVLVSGGFTYFVERIAGAAGFRRFQANELRIEAGTLTGEVKMPILGRQAKETALRDIAAELSISPNETLAVGDGANDLDMIGAAGLGVAFRAKPKVAEAADASIRHGDLTALLYAQGYLQSEFSA